MDGKMDGQMDGQMISLVTKSSYARLEVERLDFV